MQTVYENKWLSVLYNNNDGRINIKTNFSEVCLNINSYVEEELLTILYCNSFLKNNQIFSAENILLFEENMKIKAQIKDNKEVFEIDHNKNELLLDNICNLPDFCEIKHSIKELLNA